MNTASVFSKVIDSRRHSEISSLLHMGLTQEDAEDIFQEASIVLYETINSQRLTFTKSPEDYLHGICQNMAYKKIEELKRSLNNIDENQLDRLLELTEEPEEESPKWNYCDLLSRLLSELSERDYALLRDFYVKGLSMEEVAVLHNLASVEVARTTKCRIISRLRERAKVLSNKYF